MESQRATCPTRTPATVPNPAPSAIPRPVCFGLFIALLLAAIGWTAEAAVPTRALGDSLAIHWRLRWLVAELPHLAEQLRQRHARKCLEQRRHLRRHFGDVASDFVHPGGIAVSGGDDGDLVDVGQRTGQRPDHLRHAGEQPVDHRCLVVFLIGFGLYVHGLGFGLTFLENDFGFGLPLRAYRRCVPFGLRNQALLFGRGEGLNALTLNFCLLQYSCNQFFLAAVDLRFLHLDLLLFLDLL